jgi:dienelactone hydrolase
MAAARTRRRGLIAAGAVTIALVAAAWPGAFAMYAHALRGSTVIASSLVSRLGTLVAPPAADVIHITQILAPDGGQGEDRLPITVDVWFNNAQAPVPPTPSMNGTARPLRTLLLYTAGGAHTRADNAATATALARRGYTVVALDDIERAPEREAHGIEPLSFDFSSAEGYERTLRRGDGKVHQQAIRLVETLDRLTAQSRRPEAPAWIEGLRLDAVGAFGWSLGGATAAEASVLDSRVRAAANLDGWLFGQAARGYVNAPYMLIMSDYPFPSDSELDDPIASRRYEARLTRRDLTEERRLIGRPGSLGLRLPHAVHENLSDSALGISFWRTWFRVDPIRTKALVNACLDAFFDHHLRGAPPRGCLTEAYADQDIQRLTTIEWPRAGTATAPI